MVVVLLFGSKSHVTWLELKNFVGFVQVKKQKNDEFIFGYEGGT
jgi:hypothetical protein